MKNKFLSSLMAVIMVLSCLSAVSVAATGELPSNIGIDYTPGVVTNAITEEKLSATYSANNWPNENAALGTWKNESAWSIATSTQNAASVQASGGWGVQGYSIGTFADKSEVFKAGKNVIVSFEACRWSDSTACVDPIMNVAIRQDNGLPIYPIEYPSGVSVSHTDWQTYTFTLPIPEGAQAGNLSLVVGFHYTQDNQGRRGFNIKAGTISVSKEYAYDIAAEADVTSVPAGGSFNVDAAVLNQTGVTGGVSQNVTWYALNEARDTVIEGINITPRAGGAAAIEVAETVPVGNYKLVAVAESNPDLVKAVTIEVTPKQITGDLGVDYTPGVVTNAITEEKLSATYSANNWPNENAALGTWKNESAWSIATSTQNAASVQQSGGWGVMGYSLGTFTKADVFEAGKSVIVSFEACKWKDSYVSSSDPHPVMNVAIKQTGAMPIYPLEYPNGVEVDHDEWKTYTFTLPIPETGFVGAANASIAIGFHYTQDNQGRRGFSIRAGSISVSKEYAYDIDASADVSSVTAGGSFNLDADVLNQAGNTGSLSQDITWHALNEARDTEVEGFTVTEGADGTASVKVDVTVPLGVYKLVAVSESNPALVKAATIEVKGSDSHLASIEQVAADAGKFKAMAKLMDCSDDAKSINAVLCVVLTDASGKLINYNFTAVTDTYDSSKVVDTKYCEITLTGDTDKVTVFLLDCKDAQTPTIFNATVNELTRMKEFSIN